MRRNQAGNGRPMLVRCRGRRKRIEAVGDRARKLGMIDVDGGTMDGF
jgi:hypothetical protein